MNVRRTVSRKGGWLSQVTPGVPFTLVEAEPPTTPSNENIRQKRRQPKSARPPRRLSDLGELLTVQEAAAILRVKASAIYEWIYQGKLRKINAGRHIRIALVDLEEFANCA
jgi:excisionase family DNA binding protein